MRKFVLIVSCFGLTACDSQLDNIQAQVAEDAVKQYEIAKSAGGNKIDMCVQAGMVAAAYLQAQDTANYSKWKSVETVDCAKAGIPQ